MKRFPLTTLAMAIALLVAGHAVAAPLTNLFMLHHSTGRNVIEEGDVRGWITGHNTDRGTTFEFWDHDYNHIGLTAPDGSKLGTSYNIPGDNTDPDGLLTLWTTSNSARTKILADHEVIAFKSCYPASNIETDAELEQRKDWYLAMRDVFDQYPETIFVVMSQPPRHRLATNAAEATRARAFANWLKSDAYVAGHDNVVCIDLFNEFAHADDGSDDANMLRYAYERSHYNSDSHPNTQANEIVGPWFAEKLVEAAAVLDVETDVAPGPRTKLLALDNHPNPFNPRTALSFTLAEPTHVTLAIYDLTGARVTALADRVYPAGSHSVTWDGRDANGLPLSSGVYMARAVTRDAVRTLRMTLVR